MDETTKKQLIQCGTFIGIIIVFFGLLLGLVFLSRPNYENGLRKCINEVLSETQEFSNEYIVRDFIPLESNLATSGACFFLQKKSNAKERDYALILRITTYYGPIPAVFLYNTEQKKCTFVGFYGLKSSIKHQFDQSDTDRIIQHWKQEAQEILTKISEKDENGGKI